LKEFEPITTQCAKEQNLPLNPQKLSGLCGRLLCCLMYEREFYREQMDKLPPIGSRYKTPAGLGTIIAVDVFNERVTINFSPEKQETMPYQDLDQYERLEEPTLEG
jgi:cell fate regulator YaaT (PSP1 superfamily)